MPACKASAPVSGKLIPMVTTLSAARAGTRPTPVASAAAPARCSARRRGRISMCSLLFEPPVRAVRGLPARITALLGALRNRSVRYRVRRTAPGPSMPDVNADALKTRLVDLVNQHAKLAQVINDSLFSFAELGFHEIESSKLLTATLERHGFTVARGVAGMPSGWVARFGDGRPVIALGSDIDALPNVSQVPGLAYPQPMVEGGPGHGEGHNSGQAVNIAAALALKELMQREGLPGTLMLWPGIAEELLAGKAFQVRDG